MIELSVEQQALNALARALNEEADGKKLRRELAANMRKAIEPAMSEVRSNLMSMSTGGVQSAGPPLRTEVLRSMKAEARLTGRQTGARIRMRKAHGARGFALAGRRLNRAKGWLHEVFGRSGSEVRQYGEPDYFDRPTVERRAHYRQAVLDAMNAMARRIKSRVR